MSSYSDTLEALSNAATVGQWHHVGQKGFYLDHTIITVEGQVVATLDDAIYHDSPNADLIVSLVNHADDFVRLLRAAERKVTNDPRRCAELAEALAPFEEE